MVNYRADGAAPEGSFQGEGLLAVQERSVGPVHVFVAHPGADAVPSIRARVQDQTVVVASEGPVQQMVDDGPGGILGALGRWGDRYASALEVGPIRAAPTIWCSWYHYFTKVTEQDMLENLDAIEDLQLPVDVVQLDDGYQAEIGDG